MKLANRGLSRRQDGFGAVPARSSAGQADFGRVQDHLGGRPDGFGSRPDDLGSGPDDFGSRPDDLSSGPDDLSSGPDDLGGVQDGLGGVQNEFGGMKDRRRVNPVRDDLSVVATGRGFAAPYGATFRSDEPTHWPQVARKRATEFHPASPYRQVIPPGFPEGSELWPFREDQNPISTFNPNSFQVGKGGSPPLCHLRFTHVCGKSGGKPPFPT